MSVKLAAHYAVGLALQIFADMALQVCLVGIDHALNFVRVCRLGQR